MTAVGITFFVLLLIGMPVGYVLGIAGIVGIAQIGGERFLAMAPARFFAGLDLFPFLAMPFFILAGELMNRSGITDRLVGLADALVGWLRGGMAHSNMVASVFFAGITGAATADAAAFGNTLVPAMVRQGYSRPFACAVTAAGSIIGPTIPPSTLMVIYGSIMGVSIAGLFAAGVIPGLLICALCMGVIAGLARPLNLPKSDKRPSLLYLVRAFRRSAVALVLPVIVLGGILGGITTPTEAAAIAALYALFLATVVYRKLSFGALYEIIRDAARSSGVVGLIIAGALVFNYIVASENIPNQVASALQGIDISPIAFLLLVNLLFLALGCLFDATTMLLIVVPLFLPACRALDIDLVHFGVVIVVNIMIGLITPPYGVLLFVINALTGIPLKDIIREIWPFLVALILALLVMTLVPDIVLWLPRIMGYRG